VVTKVFIPELQVEWASRNEVSGFWSRESGSVDVSRVGRSNPSPKTEYLVAHEVHEGRINDDFETGAASEVQAR
jgi:hypothetical protein